MSVSSNQVIWKLCFLGAVVAGAFALWLYLRPGANQLQKEKHLPLPPFSESRYQNTGADARYIGSAACAKCHPSNHRSYLHTAHSEAFAKLNPDAQPPAGSFHHKASGRQYRVYHQDGQMRHEEILRTAEGAEITRMDVPIHYRVGSGRIGRTYLFEIDGFLHESPITWYAALKKWKMSPGYDFKSHWGFERPVSVGCLACHTGQVQTDQDSVHRVKIHQWAIGCESCHGPGSVHAELHTPKERITGEDDLTIVNPGKLPPKLAEAVCAFCHLDGEATVLLRGRGPTDFRPGRPLTEYCIKYQFESDDKQMTVVGHVGQMRLSACYKESKSMTCLTCHNPHMARKPNDFMVYYRNKCLNCHKSESCGLQEKQRLQKDPRDNCVACHMPSTGTDVPHSASTHHRIGIHAEKTRPELPGMGNLVPIDDNPLLDPVERRRNLGLAYFIVSEKPHFKLHAGDFRKRARRLLDAAFDAGLRDGETAEALGQLYWKVDYGRAKKFFQTALAAKHLPPDSRDNALLLLADCHLKDYQVDKAVELLKKLVKYRRRSEDWRLLGRCYQELKQPRKALKALQQALAIRPYRPDVHAGLAEAYRQLGDTKRANEHDRKAKWLAAHGQE